MEETHSKQLPPDFQNYRNNRSKGKKQNKPKPTESAEHLFDDDDDDDQEIPQISLEKDAEMLGNSLSGMSKEEISKHHELCMRLAAENKITLKNSFGLHLIAIMKQMVKDCPDLQLASLSLAASSKIYCGRVEALYKDTFQFHSNLQTMVSTGKKSKKDDIDNNSEEDPNENRRTRSNKAKSYLTSPESISLDTQKSGSRMPHSNFVVINSAFSASRSAKKLLSLPFESDSNKLTLSSCSVFRPRQPISTASYGAHKKLTEILEKVKELNARSGTLEDMDASSSVFFPPDKSFSPVQNFEPPNDDFAAFSPAREDNNDMGGIIDRFSIMNITADAFTQDIVGAITSGNTLDAQRLPPNSVLKKVLKSSQKVKTAPKPKREFKPKEPFFSGEPQIDISRFIVDRKKSMQAASSDWSTQQTSVFFSNEEFHNSIHSNSDSKSPDDSLEERLGIPLPSRYASDTDTRKCFRSYFLKHGEVWVQQRQRNSQNLRIRPSSLGMAIAGRSMEPSSDDLAQSFRDLSLRDSFSEKPSDYGSSPCPGEDALPADSGGEYLCPDLPEGGDSDLFTDATVVDISGSHALERDVKSMMVAPPELVKPLNVRFEVVPNSINMEKGKDLLWTVLSSHLNKEESILLSKVHKELDLLMKCTPNTNKQSVPEGISLQFTFVILLILANEKNLLLENIADSDDITVKRDICEMDSTERF